MDKCRIFIKCILLCLLTILLFAGCSFGNKNHVPEPEPTAPVYIDVEKTDELKLYANEKTSTPLSLSPEFGSSISQFLKEQKPVFNFSKYYGLEEALGLYNNTEVNKSQKSDLLNSSGLIDPKKLLSSVEANNKKEMSGGKNALNTFYTETDEEDKMEICNLIAKVVNEACNKEDIGKMGNTLSAMKLFNRKGSPSNAYITNSLVFIYNPTMSGMYANMQNISTGESKENMLKSVLVHEIMHLIQHKDDDLMDDNGVEVGMCRLYNNDANNKKLAVDSLWNSWILEAAAELGMADYLNMDTHTYAKKISYANSYNLSHFTNLKEENLLDQVAFCSTLEEAYQLLGLETTEDQLLFMEFMYSVEILQADPGEFWDNYTALTGLTPTEEEKLDIRMSIRSDVVKYLTYNFYTNLVAAIKDGTVNDLETVFYLMRLWEIDCFGHLEYSKIASLESATSFILWQDEIQTALLNEIVATTDDENLSVEYHNYCMQVSGDPIILNCNFKGFDSFVKSYLSDARENFSTVHFARNSYMIQYLQSSSSKSVS